MTSITDKAQMIVEAGRRMLHAGLTVETWGNISCRGEDEDMFITPSAMPYENLEPEDVVCLGLDGALRQGKHKPSVEAALHRFVYLARADAGAIVHTHPVHSNIFACMGEEIPLILDEAAQTLGAAVKVAPYALPGSEDLAWGCVEALGERGMACLLSNHGAVCVGKNLAQCFKVAAVLEMTARVYGGILSVGRQARPITEENLHALATLGKAYGQP